MTNQSLFQSAKIAIVSMSTALCQVLHHDSIATRKKSICNFLETIYYSIGGGRSPWKELQPLCKKKRN